MAKLELNHWVDTIKYIPNNYVKEKELVNPVYLWRYNTQDLR